MATHAYLGIKNGECRAVTVDDGRPSVAKDVADWMKSGCTIERVTLDVARRALFQPWPLPAEPNP